MKLSDKKGGVFILGMRRSGTSVLRKLIEEGTGGSLVFEPHDMWFAIRRAHLDRIVKTPGFIEAAKSVHKHFGASGLRGMKLALDPGIELFEWRWICECFDGPRFVFIRRDRSDTYASYLKQDNGILRGAVSENIHQYFWHIFYRGLQEYADAHPKTSIMMQYESLVRKPEDTLKGLFEFLGYKPNIKSLASQIQMPEQRRALK